MAAFITILIGSVCRHGSYGMSNKVMTVLTCFGLFGISGCSDPEMILPGERIAVTQQIELLPVNQQALSEGAGLPRPLKA